MAMVEGGFYRPTGSTASSMVIQSLRKQVQELTEQIEFLGIELRGHESVRKELTEVLGLEVPRWSTIVLAVGDLVEKNGGKA